MADSIPSIVTLQNIDDEDFVFEYNRSEGNSPFTIPTGAIVRYPSFLADHAAKHLVDKILTKRRMKTNNEEARTEIMNQVIIGEESLSGKSVVNEAERLQAEVVGLNQPSTLENILKEKNKKIAPAVSDVPVIPITTEERFEGLDTIPDSQVVDTTEVSEVPPPSKKARPTFGEVVDYAKNSLKLDLDSPDKDGVTTREKLGKMKLNEAIKEVNYPVEE